MPDPAPPRIQRINVAVNPAMVDAIDRVINNEQVSLTEAVRRLITYGDYIYAAVKIHGAELMLRQPDGGTKAVELL